MVVWKWDYKIKGCTTYWVSSVQFRCSVMSDSLKPHGLQHTRFLMWCYMERWHESTPLPALVPLIFSIIPFNCSSLSKWNVACHYFNLHSFIYLRFGLFFLMSMNTGFSHVEAHLFYRRKESLWQLSYFTQCWNNC